MKIVQKVMLFLAIACIHQGITSKNIKVNSNKISLKKEQSIPETLKDALEAINKKLKSKNIKKKDIEYLQRAQKAIMDVQKSL